jgi:ABC-type multidrug transport system fused ATPase/permease subunit
VLPLNQKIAVVGSVGSGKTTLLEALIGELPLDSGAIAVRFDDGTEVDLWRSDAYRRLRSLIAYSPQQPFLSNATMSSNIDLSSKATSDDVDMAIFAAQLDQDLATFTRGLDEEVGESGINLSGGQKQRVSLARAFISKRPFLVLDDPLSAVDSRTEERLMDQILARGAGVILVSHRLSELERCDRVLVLERGAVVEDGLPRTLALNPRSKFSSFLQATEEHDH